MEDAHATILQLDDHRWSRWSYFGIFDGHAGSRTAIRSAEKLHAQIVSSLDKFVEETLPEYRTNTNPISSTLFDRSKFEITIKDAYFKFDHEWREENRNHNPG